VNEKVCQAGNNEGKQDGQTTSEQNIGLTFGCPIGGGVFQRPFPGLGSQA
jgi:hypothetical protein